MRTLNLLLFVFVFVAFFKVSFSEEQKQNDELVSCPNNSDCNGLINNTDANEEKKLPPESVPIESVSENIESVSKPLGKSSEGIESISTPVESLSKPLDSVSVPLGEVSRPLGSVSKPIESYSVPVESMIGGSEIDSEDSVDSDSAVSKTGGSKDMEDITWEEIAPPADESDALDVDSAQGELTDSSINEYKGIDGTRQSYCKWTDEDGTVHIESGRKCFED